MSNLPEPPPLLTEKLSARKVFRTIGAGIFLLANIINSICIAVIFIHISSTIPALRSYASYVAFYTLGARTVFLVGVFVIGCYWCCLRLVAPKQAGSSIKEWGLKVQQPLNPRNGKLGKAGRIIFATMGVLNAFNGFSYVFLSWTQKEPEFNVYLFVLGLVLLLCAAWSIYIAYVGRVSTKKGARRENKTVAQSNDDSQPELDEVTPAGEYTTTQ